MKRGEAEKKNERLILTYKHSIQSICNHILCVLRISMESLCTKPGFIGLSGVLYRSKSK